MISVLLRVRNLIASGAGVSAETAPEEQGDEIERARQDEREECARVVETFEVVTDDRRNRALIKRIANEVRNRQPRSPLEPPKGERR